MPVFTLGYLLCEVWKISGKSLDIGFRVRFVKEKAHGRRMGQASNRKADSIGRYIHHRSGAELQPFADRNQKFVEQGGSNAVEADT